MFYDTSYRKCVEIVLSIQAIHVSIRHFMEYFFLVCVCLKKTSPPPPKDASSGMYLHAFFQPKRTSPSMLTYTVHTLEQEQIAEYNLHCLIYIMSYYQFYQKLYCCIHSSYIITHKYRL